MAIAANAKYLRMVGRVARAVLVWSRTECSKAAFSKRSRVLGVCQDETGGHDRTGQQEGASAFWRERELLGWECRGSGAGDWAGRLTARQARQMQDSRAPHRQAGDPGGGRPRPFLWFTECVRSREWTHAPRGNLAPYGILLMCSNLRAATGTHLPHRLGLRTSKNLCTSSLGLLVYAPVSLAVLLMAPCSRGSPSWRRLDRPAHYLGTYILHARPPLQIELPISRLTPPVCAPSFAAPTRCVIACTAEGRRRCKVHQFLQSSRARWRTSREDDKGARTLSLRARTPGSRRRTPPLAPLPPPWRRGEIRMPVLVCFDRHAMRPRRSTTPQLLLSRSHYSTHVLRVSGTSRSLRRQLSSEEH
ncbi:hypothetical protein BD311DRAFT_241048 [Dichomitus squalens]|uniref:Uncharacterized protein n=1 Tax=Dichomitus squalens TaxID=114155 RepID=A0A4Q9MU37_9APHY|nr:hypothetical protein BD311DRAFT_241048 [Dichomitus squalens]